MDLFIQFLNKNSISLCCSFLLICAYPLKAADAQATTPEFSGEIVIGATFPLSGFWEMYGQSAYYGANTSVKLINANGGVNGKKLTLIWRDNKGDSQQATRDIEELVSKYNVQVILGPLLSDATMAARSVVKQLKVVIMSPMTTIGAASRENTWIFSSSFSNAAEAEGLIRFQMDKYGAKTCGIIFDPRYVFSPDLADIFEKKFTSNGGTVVGKYSLVADNGEVDYQAPLEKISAGAPDFIFAPCYALEATELIHKARDLNIGLRFCGSSTWDNELVFDASGSRLAGSSFASSLFEQAFSYRPFQMFFTAMEQAGMDNPDAQAACAYDAVNLIAQALKQGEKAEDIRKGLLTTKRMPLATGRITITPDGETIKPVLIRVVERAEGRLLPVYAERYDP